MSTTTNIINVGGSNSEQPSIPEYLIKETIDGIPFYYRGFRSVVNQLNTKEAIMADSGLQGFLKAFLVTLLARQLDLDKYHFFVGEMGAHIDTQNNLSLDLAIFDQATLLPEKITTKYIDVPPKVVIEIDVNVELKEVDSNSLDFFVLRKVKKLHQFGVEKVIWIFSKNKTVIIATPDQKWDVLDWNQDIEILEGITFNAAQYLEKKGIQPDDFEVKSKS